MYFFLEMAKLNFQHHYSSLSSDNIDYYMICIKHLCWVVLFQDSLMNRKKKKSFCKITNVFTVTFDQFNAFFMNINLFKKRTPNVRDVQDLF